MLGDGRGKILQLRGASGRTRFRRPATRERNKRKERAMSIEKLPVNQVLVPPVVPDPRIVTVPPWPTAKSATGGCECGQSPAKVGLSQIPTIAKAPTSAGITPMGPPPGTWQLLAEAGV